MDLIEHNIDTVNKDGDFKSLQKGLLKGGAFGDLTGPILKNMYEEGVDFMGIILNTASCD